jgi:DNA-binding FrmR family transcriptional regulator
MSHFVHDKKKLLNRVRRIRGQLNAIERELEQDRDCTETLQTIAACRGAMNGLMAQVLEGHVRHHVLDPGVEPTAEQADAAQELLDVIRTYLR